MLRREFPEVPLPELVLKALPFYEMLGPAMLSIFHRGAYQQFCAPHEDEGPRYMPANIWIFAKPELIRNWYRCPKTHWLGRRED